MSIEVITSLSDLDNVSAEDKATKIFMYPDVANKQFTYYQWDSTASEWAKLSDSVNGSIVSSSDYIRAIIDSDLNVLAGIEPDGNVIFSNIPRQITDYVGQFFSIIDNDEYAYAIIDKELNILFKINK